MPLLSPIPPFTRLFKATGAGAVLDAGTPTLQAAQVTRLHARLELGAFRSEACQAALRDAIERYSWTGVAARYTREYDLAMGLA